MPTVYFTTESNFNPELANSKDLKYYLDLVVHEVAECLGTNGINFIYENDVPLSSSKQLTKTDAVEITLKENSTQGPIPCEKRGIFILFTPGDPNSKRLAVSISKNIQNIYTDPSLVKLIAPQNPEAPTSPEVPSVIIEICYVDDPNDVFWLRQNIEELAKSIVMSILEYFGVPFTQCQKSIFGFTTQDANIMKRPLLNSEVVGSLQANTKVKIIGQWENWYIVFYDNNLGYVQTKYIIT